MGSIMMKPTYSIAIAAIVVLAAIAGVAMVADDADATDASVKVTFEVYEDEDLVASVVRTVSGDTYIIPTPEEIGLGDYQDEFSYWLNGSVRYYAGNTLDLSTVESEITLTMTIESPSVVTVVIGDGSADAGTIVIDGTTYYVVPEVADEDIPEGTIFVGWDVETQTVYYTESEGSCSIADADTEGAESVEVFVDVEVGDTVSAVFEEVYTVTFVVEGTTVYTSTSDVYVQPQDPYKEHYDFAGWAVDGEIVSKVVAGEITLDGYDIVGDTEFVAVFEPELLTVTLVVDGEAYGTVSVLYGDGMVMPALPEGYGAWAFFEDYSAIASFPLTVTGSISLYAVPEDAPVVVPEEGYTVQFVRTSSDGSVVIISTQVITEENAVLNVPDAPALDGYDFVGWFVGTERVDPATYAIEADTTFVAMYEVASEAEPDTGVYVVTLYAGIDGDVFYISFSSDNRPVSIPEPSVAGYVFKGWAIQGTTTYIDPLTYTYTADTVIVAMFEAEEVISFDVTFQYADGTSETVSVVDGETVELPELDEGMVWALGNGIYTAGAVTSDMTLTEVKEYNSVYFSVDGVVYSAYTQSVRYGEKATAPEQFVFPDGYDGWNFDFSTVIVADTTIAAAPIVVEEPVQEPAFYETTTGQIAIVLIVFIVLLFGYAVYSNMFGLRDKLSRKDKDKEE